MEEINVDEEIKEITEVNCDLKEKSPNDCTNGAPENITEDEPKEPSLVVNKENEENVLDAHQEVDMDTETSPIHSDESYLADGKTIELARYIWHSDENKQQYLRGCLWSPDGLCVLTAVNQDGMHVIEMPTNYYNFHSVDTNRNINKLTTAVHVKEGGTVYDYCWYPLMDSSMAETCCWLATRQHEPIHLWDAFDGTLRCSYKGFNAVDEVETAVSVAFKTDGEQVLGGYKKSIKIFNTTTPEKKYTEIKTKNTIACFALTETQTDLIATGSWNCKVDLYDIRVSHLGPLATFTEHKGGITCMKFTPDGLSLFSGARKSNDIFQWDMRNFTKPLRKLERNVRTNQRISIDVSVSGKWLASGDTNGLVHVWNINENFKEFNLPVHKDCCNGVDFHKGQSILATTSGQHHFIENHESENSGIIEMYENSLILWWIGKVSDTSEL